MTNHFCVLVLFDYLVSNMALNRELGCLFTF